MSCLHTYVHHLRRWNPECQWSRCPGVVSPTSNPTVQKHQVGSDHHSARQESHPSQEVLSYMWPISCLQKYFSLILPWCWKRTINMILACCSALQCWQPHHAIATLKTQLMHSRNMLTLWVWRANRVLKAWCLSQPSLFEWTASLSCEC